MLAVAGCQSGNTKVVVKGQIVLDGTDLALAESEADLMSLIPMDGKPDQSPCPGSVKRDESFLVAGP